MSIFDTIRKLIEGVRSAQAAPPKQMPAVQDDFTPREYTVTNSDRFSPATLYLEQNAKPLQMAPSNRNNYIIENDFGAPIGNYDPNVQYKRNNEGGILYGRNRDGSYGPQYEDMSIPFMPEPQYTQPRNRYY